MVFLLDYRKTPGAEYIRYLGAENLLLRQSLILDHYPADHLGVDKAKVNNHWFSVKTLGDHLIEVPARAVFFLIHSENTLYFITRLFSTVFITIFILYFIIQKHYGILVAATLFLGTPVWNQVRYTHSDIIGGALCFLGIWLLEKRKAWTAGFVLGFAFLVRYQLSVFIGPFLSVYFLRNLINKKFLFGLLPFIGFTLCVIIQLAVNNYYFGSPFNFNVLFFAPDPPATYEGIQTVMTPNTVLSWDFRTIFSRFYELQIENKNPTMIKWMFWFYPALFFIRSYVFKIEYLAAIIAFSLYLYGIEFLSFRYFGSLCFLSVPILIRLPKVWLWFILIFGLVFINIYGEYIYFSHNEFQPFLHSKFGFNIYLSLVPSVFFLVLWIYFSIFPLPSKLKTGEYLNNYGKSI